SPIDHHRGSVEIPAERVPRHCRRENGFEVLTIRVHGHVRDDRTGILVHTGGGGGVPSRGRGIRRAVAPVSDDAPDVGTGGAAAGLRNRSHPVVGAAGAVGVDDDVVALTWTDGKHYIAT